MKLRSAKGHFVRCIKPNRVKIPGIYEPRMVMQQLRSLSVLEAIDLRRRGYAYRTTFREFVSEREYFPLLLCAGQTQVGSSLDELKAAATKIVDWVRANMESSEEGDTACFVGKTMVFFTRAAQRILIQLKRRALQQIRPAAYTIQAAIRGQPVFF